MGALFGKDTGPNTAGTLVPDTNSPLFGWGGAGSDNGLFGPGVPAAIAAVLGAKLSPQQQMETLDQATGELPAGSCGNFTQGYLKNIAGDKDRHCYWGNPDLTPGDFPAPPQPQRPVAGYGSYGGYGGYPQQAGAAGAGYGASGAVAGMQGSQWSPGQPPRPQQPPPPGPRSWHGESGQRWKAGAPPQKRSGDYALPETAITGPPEHIEPINPYHPPPSPKEEANSRSRSTWGAVGRPYGCKLQRTAVFVEIQEPHGRA
ncbi:unnamed protein product [Durusdinium trenchii]|uniref:Uncharacterized protein n=1 Tax=Durusdinium trenchii TaxID=1381693 RepID=A0ABP0SUG8_9DINO